MMPLGAYIEGQRCISHGTQILRCRMTEKTFRFRFFAVAQNDRGCSEGQCRKMPGRTKKRRTEQNRSDQPIKSFGNFNDQTEVEHSRLVPGIRRTDHILDQSGKSHCGTPFQCPSCAGNDSDCLYPFPEMSGPAFCDTFTVREFRLDPCQIDTAEMEQIKVPDYMEIVFPCPVETRPPFHRRGQHRGFGISC